MYWTREIKKGMTNKPTTMPSMPSNLHPREDFSRVFSLSQPSRGDSRIKQRKSDKVKIKCWSILLTPQEFHYGIIE